MSRRADGQKKTSSKGASKAEMGRVTMTAGLLLLDAMVTHEVLASHSPSIPTLAELRDRLSLKAELSKTWTEIIRSMDYEPVLRIALDILRALPSSPAIEDGLRTLIRTAESMAASKVLLRHDLFGRIYHTLLLGELAKYYATYYTSIPAARMLAGLLLSLPSGLDGSRPEPTFDGEPLRVVDFACGSGTLLSAVYKELDVLHRLQAEEPEPERLHRYLLEEGLWGLDVLHHAVHLATTVLFLHDPQPVRRARLYALRLGKDGEHVFLGSINFLRSSELAPNMLLPGGSDYAVESVSVSGKGEQAIELPRFHYCIMNPPFTRSVGGNLLFGALPKEERQELQMELSRLLKELGLEGIGQAGLGAVFVHLADKYLVKGGRLGLVLPRAVLTGVSWRRVRELLRDEYHIEYIVTSFEPDGWNFSENTDLSEVLLVARKKKEAHGSPEGAYETGEEYTYLVNLWDKPDNEVEAVYIAKNLEALYSRESARLFDIENSNASPYILKLGGREVGEVYSARLLEDNFGMYNFFSRMELNRSLLLLRQGMVYVPGRGIAGYVKLRPLGDLGAELGLDRRQVHSAFSTSESVQPYRALWGYDSSAVRTIAQPPNAYLAPKNQQAEKARELWERGSGKLLVVERARLSTYTVLATHLSENVLSNVWWPVRFYDDANDIKSRVLAVWLNSTPGFLLLMSIAEVTEGPWVDLKKDHLISMPVLDVDSLTQDQLGRLLRLYENVKNKPFKSLPKEFESPDAREEVDRELCDALGIEPDLRPLYRLLAAEPMLGYKGDTSQRADRGR